MDAKVVIQLIADAYANGYKKAVEDSGGLPTFLSYNKACRKYKRKRVDLWVGKKLITPIPASDKNNGALLLSRERLELLAGLSALEIAYGKVPPEEMPRV